MTPLTPYQHACVTVLVTGAVLLMLDQVCTRLGIPGGKILTMLIATLFVAAGLRRPVQTLERWFRLPRTLAILLIYLGFFTLLIGVSLQVLPIVSQQVAEIARVVQHHWVPPHELLARLPRGVTDVVPAWVLNELVIVAQTQVLELAGSLQTFAGTLSRVIGTGLEMSLELVLVLLFAFLMVREDGTFVHYMTAPIADAQRKQRVQAGLDHLMTDLGQWAHVQLLIGVCFGVGFGGCLWLFGLPYAFTLGLVGLVLEALIPMVGSLVALLLAVVIGLSASLLHGLGGVIGAYSLAFMVEWHVAYPLTMGRALRIPALVSLLALWIGYYPLGVMGSVLILPCLVILGHLARFAWPHAFHTSEPPAPAHDRLGRAVWHWRTRRVVSQEISPSAPAEMSPMPTPPTDPASRRSSS